MATESGDTRLLDRVYDDLGYESGTLKPTLTPVPNDPAWLEVGDWLILAARMGAERVFFVDNQPVVLFRQLPPGAGDAEIVQAYRSAWSLARAHCLFLATEDELRVYSLASPPVKSESHVADLEPLQVVRRAADVAESLAEYHRERMESGGALEQLSRDSRAGYADRRLVTDVQLATRALVAADLEPQVAHALIERVLLVRYLEDRGVITSEYFQEIAERRSKWSDVLRRTSGTPDFGAESLFVNCLMDKRLTFAVFERLAEDFNGDLFVPVHGEIDQIEGNHLELVRRLLTGAGTENQEKLFLWAYDFSVVPTSLISAMYEQFYRAGTDDDSGTYYTPPELVEHVLALTLDSDILEREPRVIDPACGSGIFLVESLRRMVRHEMIKTGRPIPPSRLRTLLTRRISGVDVNAEAIRLAAFSLYLTFLNYQTPQDIRSAGPLPPLIYRPEESGPRDSAPVLFVGDAFAPLKEENQTEALTTHLPWSSRVFDVVVGNPPWTRPDEGPRAVAEQWADDEGLPYANRDPSQLFLWRSLDFLAWDGVASVLVGAMAIYNVRGMKFRREWLDHVNLTRVVNFAATREVFFSGAIAPFLLLQYGHARESNGGDRSVRYETVLPSAALRASETVAYANIEQRWVRQSKLRHRDYLWKTYAWGGHHDDSLLARLDAEKSIGDVVPDDPGPGYGYQWGDEKPTKLLGSLRSLRNMEIWGALQDGWFEPPPQGVKRQPDERRYDGLRIVMKRGAKTGFGPIARLESEPFSFRHIIYCLPLPGVAAWQAKTILGVILSSLGRYRLFMTTGSWGIWHDSFVPRDVLELPIRFVDGRADVTRRIGRAVDQLQNAAPEDHGSSLETGPWRPKHNLSDVLEQLDGAVFDLFELTPGERDLVRNFHEYTLDLVTRKVSSTALAPLAVPADASGLRTGIPASIPSPLTEYLTTFLDAWNRELSGVGEFSWRLIDGGRSNLLGAVFETRPPGTAHAESIPDVSEWEVLLERLGVALSHPVSTLVRRTGILRAVTDTSITVIKPNQRRLWTATAAREDVEATMLRAMSLTAS